MAAVGKTDCGGARMEVRRLLHPARGEKIAIWTRAVRSGRFC